MDHVQSHCEGAQALVNTAEHMLNVSTWDAEEHRSL